MPYMQFLFVRPGLCLGFLQIPPRDGHPCLWLTVGAINPRNELSPSRSRACRTHTYKVLLHSRKEDFVFKHCNVATNIFYLTYLATFSMNL
jgi:hypothetical protein